MGPPHPPRSLHVAPRPRRRIGAVQGAGDGTKAPVRAGEEKTNVNGGAIALGHPPGATGADLSTQRIHELRRHGGGTGLVTMSVGGGMGAAGIFEVYGA